MRRVTSVIGLALTLMVLLVVPGSTGAPEVVGASPVVAKITFTDAIGNPVDHAKVTDLGNGWLSIPNAQLVDDSVAGVLDHEQLFEAVLVALTDVNNLRQWQLCAAELTYGAEKSQASGDAVIKFPLDRPSHYPDTPADLTRKAGLHYRYASALYKAAELADDYGIECTKPPVTEYAH
ncbi:MAG TPA: hypothetical protein VLA88_05705, partial [Candidatus Saccharimonadales bacterium]|nr:hypothetical protein [Candidatus Saccharimonadales bacterium]